MIKKLLNLLLVTVCLPSLLQAVTKNKPFQEYNYSKGLDSYHNPQSLPEGYVQDANNVLFDDRGPVTKRYGYSTVWGVNQTTGTSIVIIQGYNDRFAMRLMGIGYPVVIPPGIYPTALALASTMTASIAAQTMFQDSFTYVAPNFIFESTTSGRQFQVFGSPNPNAFTNFSNTIGFPSSLHLTYAAAGAGPVFVSTAPQSPIFSLVGPSINNLWTYTDQTNTSWEIARSSSQLTANNFNGTTVVIATISVNNVVGETNAFGNAYFVDQTNGVYSWNGSSTVYVSGSPKGSIITQFHNRLWVTGAAVPNGNQLYSSAYYSGSIWTTGLNPTDPVQLSIGLQDNFDNITAEYVYLDTLYLFKHSSIFALYGFDQTSFQISQLTQECGCIDGGSIQTFNSALEFVSLRGIESFNGYSCTRISDPIKNKVDPAIQVRSYTTQSWVQSQQQDWQNGTLFNLSATAAPPSLVISTQAAFSGVDSTQANWQAGTLNNMDSVSYAPGLGLTLSTSIIYNGGSGPSQSNTTSSGNISYGSLYLTDFGQSFMTNSTPYQQWSSVLIPLCQFVGPQNITVQLAVNNGGVPGAVLASAVVSDAGVPTCGSGFSYVLFNMTPTVLSPSTLYWIVLPKEGTFSNSAGWAVGPKYNGLNNWSSLQGFGPSSYLFSSTIHQGIVSYNATSGSILSRVFDAGVSTATWLFNWGTFNTSEVDNGGTISYETQVSSSASGPWDSPVSVTPGGTIGSANKEFIQYIATFSNAGNPSQTPVLSSVTLNTSVMERSSGTIQSQVWNVGALVNWGNFTVQDILNGGNIAFSICSSTNVLMSPASCSIQNPNSQIVISTFPYVQWFASFTVTSATQTPALQSVTVQWFSGANNIPMSSTVWDNRYWLSLTTNTADSFNDAVLVLNHTGAWSVFDIHAGAFIQYKNLLYHGDSTPTGYIYLDNQGESDNLFPINAYIHTRTNGLGDYSTDDYLYALYPSALNTGNCSMSVTYRMDLASSYTLGSPLLSEYGTMSSVRLPFPIDSSHQDFGQTIDLTFGTDDATCDWIFYGYEGLFKSRVLK